MKLNTLKVLTWLSNATPESSEACHHLVVHDMEDNAVASKEEHLTRMKWSFNNQVKENELSRWRMKQKCIQTLQATASKGLQEGQEIKNHIQSWQWQTTKWNRMSDQEGEWDRSASRFCVQQLLKVFKRSENQVQPWKWLV